MNQTGQTFGFSLWRGVLLLVLSALMISPALAADYSVGALAGYKGGLAFRVSGAVSGFAQNFPLALEAGIGYSIRDPGVAADVRRIFINEATNGTPEKSGSAWDMRLDFLYRMKRLGLEHAYLFAGVRYSLFTGSFEYIGGNEKFDITANQFGLGLGIKALFPMGGRVDLVVSAGAEHYFPAALKGHDTTYTPDDDNVNPKENFTYANADEAVNQPKFQPVVLLGVSVRL